MEKKTISLNKSSFSFKDFFTKDNLPLILIIMLSIYAVIAILISVLALKIPVVAVCAIIVLETLLASCLNKIPLWIHGLVFIAEIVAGIMASKVIFMILMALMYFFACVFLFMWSRHE